MTTKSRFIGHVLAPTRRLAPLFIAASTTLALAPFASAQLSITTTLPGTFVDISGTGTPLSLGLDATTTITTTVGNSLLRSGSVRVGSNGAIRFQGTGIVLGYQNAAIPSNNCFDGEQALLPFWDDLWSPGGLFGEIYWQETNGTLIVQWENIALYPSTSSRATFQVQVHSSGGTYAQYLYEDVTSFHANGGRSATIGYQAGPCGLGNDYQFSFNTPGAVMNGDVLSLVGTFTPPVTGPTTVSLSDSIPGTWLDISGTGAALGLCNNCEVDIPTTVGNSLIAAGTARVGSNGAVGFGGWPLPLSYFNIAIPALNAFGYHQALMPFWDDIATEGGTVGEIYWQEIGGTLVVQWEAVGFWLSPPSETATFQVQVFSTGPYIAQFLYQDVEGLRADRGGSATIGYQHGNATGNCGNSANHVQYSLDQPVLSNGDVLTLIADFGAPGEPFCTPNANSTGQPSSITANRPPFADDPLFALTASPLPLHSNGFYVMSAATMAEHPVSAGNLCLAPTFYRFQLTMLNSGGSGMVVMPMPWSNLPTAILAGQSWHFQYWHRDTGLPGTSNFSRGLTLLFM